MTIYTGRPVDSVYRVLLGILYKLFRISDDLLTQRNKKVKAQPRPFYSSELVNRLKSYPTCSKK